MAANRVLVVEDNKAISDFIAINLQYTGYDYMVFAEVLDEKFKSQQKDYLSWLG